MLLVTSANALIPDKYRSPHSGCRHTSCCWSGRTRGFHRWTMGSAAVQLPSTRQDGRFLEKKRTRRHDCELLYLRILLIYCNVIRHVAVTLTNIRWKTQPQRERLKLRSHGRHAAADKFRRRVGWSHGAAAAAPFPRKPIV